jgi:hypothetical protein
MTAGAPGHRPRSWRVTRSGTGRCKTIGACESTGAGEECQRMCTSRPGWLRRGRGGGQVGTGVQRVLHAPDCGPGRGRLAAGPGVGSVNEGKVGVRMRGRDEEAGSRSGSTLASATSVPAHRVHGGGPMSGPNARLRCGTSARCHLPRCPGTVTIDHVLTLASTGRFVGGPPVHRARCRANAAAPPRPGARQAAPPWRGALGRRALGSRGEPRVRLSSAPAPPDS